MKEQVVLFGKNKSLVGITTEPHSASPYGSLPAIIILNAGLLHRIGPNRLSVKIARQMAVAGFLVLRFDFSGIGDSGMRVDNLPFEKSSIGETQEAMNYLSSIRGIKRFILMGICSGANVALRTACHDHRVVGMIGINGSYFDSQESTGLNQYLKSSIQSRYYRKHLLNYKSWWRVITGKSNLSSITGFLINKTKNLLYLNKDILFETKPSTKWSSLVERGVDLFLIYSEGSLALDTFRLALENHLSELRSSGKIWVDVIKYSDHVFTLLWSQNILTNFIHQWAQNRQRNWISV
jgi:pimeloyl-ACP methyl ester carboxylesterase